MNETIEAAAILQNGKIYKGFRHHLIIRDIVKELNIKPVTGEQGFVTNSGRFVEREEALKIALAANQIKIENKIGNKNILFSEEVWPDYRDSDYKN